MGMGEDKKNIEFFFCNDLPKAYPLLTGMGLLLSYIFLELKCVVTRGSHDPV
jgi:hypothetical protein